MALSIGHAVRRGTDRAARYRIDRSDQEKAAAKGIVRELNILRLVCHLRTATDRTHSGRTPPWRGRGGAPRTAALSLFEAPDKYRWFFSAVLPSRRVYWCVFWGVVRV